MSLVYTIQELKRKSPKNSYIWLDLIMEKNLEETELDVILQAFTELDEYKEYNIKLFNLHHLIEIKDNNLNYLMKDTSFLIEVIYTITSGRLKRESIKFVKPVRIIVEGALDNIFKHPKMFSSSVLVEFVLTFLNVLNMKKYLKYKTKQPPIEATNT
jgi:hypothetical protein